MNKGRSINAFEAGMPGTPARSAAESKIEDLRLGGGLFVEAVRATRMAMAVTDPSLPGNPIVFANDAFLKLSGYQMAEVLGQQPHFMNGPDTDIADAARFEEALRSDQDDIVETVQYRKDGTRFVASVLLTAFRDKDGTTLHHFLSWLDITRRQSAERELELVHQAEIALRASEERFRAFVMTSSDVVYRMSADWSEMRQLSGAGFLADTAAPTREWRRQYIHPDDRLEVDTAIEAAVEGGKMFELEHRVLRADGSIGWTHSRAVPILEDSGRISEWLGSAEDVTASREEREKYRVLFDSIDEGFCIIEVLFDDQGKPVDYRFLETNPAFERQTGLVDAIGRTITEMVPGHEKYWFDIYGRIVRTGQPERFEDAAAGLGRWFDVYAFRIGEPGEHHVAVLFRDVLARKQAELSMQASEERQAFLLKLSDALQPLADAAEIRATTARLVVEHLRLDRAMYAEVEGERGAETGIVHGQFVRALADPPIAPFPERFAYGQFGARTMAGRYRGELLVVDDIDTAPGFEPSERAAWTDADVRAAIVAPLAKAGRLVAEFGVHSVKPRVWTEAEISLVEDVAERTWAAAERARAEAALRDSEARMRLLLAELQHRVRNILAMIQSVVRRTIDTSQSAEEYARHLGGRIATMARTQAMLTRSRTRRIDLEEVLRDELVSVIAREEQHWCEGPRVDLPPKAAEVLSLAIHELATNSVKYGALSTPGGQLEICWKLETHRGEQWLLFEWIETRVRHHGFSREGFGTELITRRVPYELGGRGSMDATADGMVAKIEFPLSRSTSILETGMPEPLR